MSGRKAKASAGKKPGGDHEFMVAALLLLVGSITVGFLWMKNTAMPPSFSKAHTTTAVKQMDASYSERDRVYLEKVLKEVHRPKHDGKSR